MSAGGRKNGLQGRSCFLCFFRPPAERKNPDWSDLMNYLIHPSDWSASCHSKPQRSSHIYNHPRRPRGYQPRRCDIFGRKFTLRAEEPLFRPEVVEFRPADWAEKFFSAQSAMKSSRVTLSPSYTKQFFSTIDLVAWSVQREDCCGRFQKKKYIQRSRVNRKP